MQILNYNQWTDTALTLHLVLQMLGKAKLSRMVPQPEWNHVLLSLTPEGFTTGLIPNGEKSFCVSLAIMESRITATDIAGHSSSFSLIDNGRVSDYYAEFNRILKDVMCETEIHPVPQEMSITTPFDEDHALRAYDTKQALDFFRMCVFAYNVELKFISAFRGKKILPQFFWGTFDVSTAVFSGKSFPFEGGGIIEKGAFDEQMIEFGFWPGDDNVVEPSFFILPYPFITDDLSKAGIKPDKAFWSNEKAEFFFKLEDALNYPDPAKAVLDFMQRGYEIVTQSEKWKNLTWFNQPLIIEKGSFALQRTRTKH